MYVVVLASQKGGAGKTTLAAHLAVAAEIAGYGPTVLIDTDPQATLSQWWQRREATTPAMAEATLSELSGKLRELSEGGFRLVFIDTPGRVSLANREVIALADLVLVPIKPSVADLWTIRSTIEDVLRRTGPCLRRLPGHARRLADGPGGRGSLGARSGRPCSNPQSRRVCRRAQRRPNDFRTRPKRPGRFGDF